MSGKRYGWLVGGLAGLAALAVAFVFGLSAGFTVAREKFVDDAVIAVQRDQRRDLGSLGQVAETDQELRELIDLAKKVYKFGYAEDLGEAARMVLAVERCRIGKLQVPVPDSPDPQ